MTLHDAGPVTPQKRKWTVFIPLAVFLALSLLLFFRLFAGDASRLPSALIGQEIPAFTLPGVEGLQERPGFSDTDLRQGHVTLVNIFASWCVPCHQEHPLLMQLAADPALAKSGVEVFGFAYKDEAENIRRFVGEAGNPYKRIGVDGAGRVAIDWGVYGVPETFVVAGDGTITYKHVGPLNAEAVQEVLLPEIAKAQKHSASAK